ncbi:hypothetical protein RPC_1348 [Rhodopseudomonas palustris BisB18]|uniref:Uncharacterized protein n=1 Tax=Rhodopseudomonas palustris (strain BisB18) TaxID=316056 RepID=Q219M6_RHOPB
MTQGRGKFNRGLNAVTPGAAAPIAAMFVPAATLPGVAPIPCSLHRDAAKPAVGRRCARDQLATARVSRAQDPQRQARRARCQNYRFRPNRSAF